MSSSDSTALQPGTAVSQCCSTTTLLSVLAASFACCFLLVLVFLCLRFLHLRRSRTRRHSAQLPQGQGQGQVPKLGLDAAAIALITCFPYRRECASSAPAECAVCLSVVEDGEMVRQLHGCKHLFHQVCIDVWLSSNASCPVCRRKAEPAPAHAEERAAASATVVPVEMLEDDIDMVPSSSTTLGTVPPRPERLGARASGSGQEMDLERQ